MGDNAKPIVKVYLLPGEWTEQELQHCFNCLLEGAKSLSALKVVTENDFIVLFPKDAMEKGLGTEIVIEAHIPKHLMLTWELEDDIARKFYAVMQGLLPAAHVQCNVYEFATSHGFRATGR